MHYTAVRCPAGEADSPWFGNKRILTFVFWLPTYGRMVNIKPVKDRWAVPHLTPFLTTCDD